MMFGSILIKFKQEIYQNYTDRCCFANRTYGLFFFISIINRNCSENFNTPLGTIKITVAELHQFQ
jgi:hypothetical protein